MVKSKIEALLALDIEKFDQDMDGGWRQYEQSDGSLKAAVLIEKYIDKNMKLLKKSYNSSILQLLYFHTGQLYASSGSRHYTKAIIYMKKSLEGKSHIWSYYVLGTIAFLRQDVSLLTHYIRQMEDINTNDDESPEYIEKTNITILRHLKKSLEQGVTSYLLAY